MGSVLETINLWASNDTRLKFLQRNQPMVLKWFNQAQLRFADQAVTLRDIWTPSIPSSGYISLPTNFLREFKDRIKRSSGDYVPLQKMKYEDANLVPFSGLTHYSIYNDTFYVWGAMSCNPIIPYVIKPTVITFANFKTSDLEIDSKYQDNIVFYMDACYIRSQDGVANTMEAKAMMEAFERDCDVIATKEQQRLFGSEGTRGYLI